jgi:hypothetical protein
MIAPGTKIDAPQIQAGLITVGVYTLIASILGFVAAARRHVCSATAFFVMNLIDFVLSVAIVVITFFADAGFTALLAQVPGLALNAYFLVVIKSYRDEIKGGANGSGASNIAASSMGSGSIGRGGGGVMDGEDGVDEEDIAAVTGSGTGGGKGRRFEVAIADDDEDADIGRGREGRVTKL